MRRIERKGKRQLAVKYKSKIYGLWNRISELNHSSKILKIQKQCNHRPSI